MPIRPIDMQTLLPKSIKLHKAKPAVVNQLQNALQNVQTEQEKKRQIDMQKISELNQKDAAKVKKKHKDDSSQKKHKKKKQHNQDDEHYHLDIKI